jgi:hypothetical protein
VSKKKGTEKQSGNLSEVHTQKDRHPKTQSSPANTPNREDIVKPLGRTMTLPHHSYYLEYAHQEHDNRFLSIRIFSNGNYPILLFKSDDKAHCTPQ